MSYAQAMRWNRKHPKGIRHLYFGFDSCSKPRRKTEKKIIEFYPQYLAFHEKNKSASKDIMVLSLQEYIKQQLTLTPPCGRKEDKMSYTKGIWEAKMSGRQVFCGKKHIATVHYAGNPPIEPNEANDNARLIAAAPQLHEACKAIQCLDISDFPLSVIRQLNAALAAAEGDE